MHDQIVNARLDDMRNFIALHSRAQQLDEKLLRQGLSEIISDDGGVQGGWTAVWKGHGDAAATSGDVLTAMKLFNMARFPYVDDAWRQQAHAQCIDMFWRWSESGKLAVEKLHLDSGSGCFSAYACNLDRNLPLLVVTGGIVSIKEQWWRLLVLGAKLGFCAVVTELPGVGENRMCYNAMAADIYPILLDALTRRANVNRTHLLAFSFGGNLALQMARHDSRIAAITTVGAPIRHFFDHAGSMPDLTHATLAHLMQCGRDEVHERIRHWALTEDDLRRVKIPVNYLASRRDEIIPLAEVEFMRKHLPGLRLRVVDDVHGAPNHAGLLKFWVLHCLLAQRGGLHGVVGYWLGRLLRIEAARKGTPEYE